MCENHSIVLFLSSNQTQYYLYRDAVCNITVTAQLKVTFTVMYCIFCNPTTTLLYSYITLLLNYRTVLYPNHSNYSKNNHLIIISNFCAFQIEFIQLTVKNASFIYLFWSN